MLRLCITCFERTKKIFTYHHNIHRLIIFSFPNAPLYTHFVFHVSRIFLFNYLTPRRVGAPPLLLTGESNVELFLNVSDSVLVTNIKKLLNDEDIYSNNTVVN